VLFSRRRHQPLLRLTTRRFLTYCPVRIPGTTIQNLPVPYPEKRIRDQIHDLVVDAYEKRIRSVSLEDDAIHLVEDYVRGSA
jgi:hypothetical protein